MRALKWVILICLGLFLGYGAWSYTRLPDPGTATTFETYGTPPKEAGNVLRIEEGVAKAKVNRNPTVTLQGKVVDMGPTMGCWLLLQDGTGEVLVQTDPMIYMPQKLREATVKVNGILTYGRFRGMNYNREGWFLFSPGVEVVHKTS